MKSIDPRTLMEMVSLIKSPISFMIKRIKVHNSTPISSPDHKFLGDFHLERFSEGDFTSPSASLTYMFTIRDFEGGTLGLAWTGDLKNAGGVCEQKGHFRGGLKSLNTGIITLLNYGKVVLPAVFYVTLAHEIGHNFGSPHGPENERECVPGGRDGNFIMFARATGGDQKNNQQFSPCSLRSIRPVLAAKARHIHSRMLYSTPTKHLCGNREDEGGEESDCGWEEDCGESCCWPNRPNPPPDQVPCTLKPGMACSPSQGPCCTSTCTLNTRLRCRDDNGCRHSSSCSGSSPVCPPSVHKPNFRLQGNPEYWIQDPLQPSTTPADTTTPPPVFCKVSTQCYEVKKGMICETCVHCQSQSLCCPQGEMAPPPPGCDENDFSCYTCIPHPPVTTPVPTEPEPSTTSPDTTTPPAVICEIGNQCMPVCETCIRCGSESLCCPAGELALIGCDVNDFSCYACTPHPPGKISGKSKRNSISNKEFLLNF